ncbi:MAG: hypothetical protein R3F19_01375 [Verrucomicrobiales bacterium]
MTAERLLTTMAVCFCGAVGGWGWRALTTEELQQTPIRVTTEQAIREVASKVQPIGGDGEGAIPASFPVPPVEEVVAASGGELRRLLVRFLSVATVEDIEALLEASQRTNRPFTGLRTYQDLIFRRAVELDAAGFVVWMKEAESMANGREYSLQSAYKAWLRIDPESAIAASATEGAIVRRGVLGALAETDPDRALDLMRAEAEGKDESWQRTLDSIEGKRLAMLADENVELAIGEAMANLSGSKRTNALSGIVASWATKDPTAAWQWLQEQDNVGDKFELGNKIISTLAMTDPSAARAMVDALPDAADKTALEVSIAKEWASQNLEAAMQWALGQSEPEHKSEMFAAVADKLAAEDPRRLFQTMIDHGITADAGELLSGFDIDTRGSGWGGSFRASSELRQIVDRAANQLAQEDPKLALAYLATLDSRGNLTDSLTRIASQWAGKDSATAAAWATTLPDGDFRSRLQRPIMETWAGQDPAAAAAFLTTNNLTSDANLVKSVTTKWAAQDAEAVLKWSAAAGPDVMLGTLGAIAASDPVRASTGVDALTDPAQRAKAIASIAGTWKNSEPQAAVQWLDTRANVDDVAKPLHESTKAWVLQAPEQASEWIGAMAEGVGKDNAVAGMVHALVSSTNPRKDFESAAIWVETIGDESLRQQWQTEIRDRLAKTEGVAIPQSEGAVQRGGVGGSIEGISIEIGE